MKVLEVYGKNDLDKLTIKGKSISKIMNDFFKQYPVTYRKNYDKNLETVEIFKIDEHYSGNHGGEYSDFSNIILFRRYYSLVHELFHMASCDYVTRRSSFEKCNRGTFFEEALIEGMTEYLASNALNVSCKAYLFETFAASTIADIDGVLESYFIPSYQKLINSFSNKRDIISLMYSLDAYFKKCEILFSDESSIDKDLIDSLEHSIIGVIDSLIDIQLSRKLSFKENKRYVNMFMDKLSEDEMSIHLGDIWEDYLD